MDVRATDDPALVVDRAGAFLRAERFSSNVPAVEVTAIVAGVRRQRPGSVWFLVEDGGRVVGLAMHTPPFSLYLPRLTDVAVETLAHALHSERRVFPGVSGEAGTVGRFLRLWAPLNGVHVRQRRATRFFVLQSLTPPAGVEGEGRRATERDAGLLCEWFLAFHDEANPGAPADDLAGRARDAIASGTSWLWDRAGAPVSMAGSTPVAVGVARVGPVYTPPDQRRRGFGAAVTSRATQACLDAGADDVVLFTDQANPTSNAIYQAIGYRPDHDAGDWDFV